MAVNRGSTSYKVVREDARKSIAAVERKLAKALKGIENATYEGLKVAGKALYDESREMTPIDTGDLRESQYLAFKRSPSKMIAEIGYDAKGGASVTEGISSTKEAPYAVYVHELQPEVHTKEMGSGRNPPRAQWKFLETAVKNLSGKIPGLIASKAK